MAVFNLGFIILTLQLCLTNTLQPVYDAKCVSQNEALKKTLGHSKLINKFQFTNETKDSVQVTWAGDNSGVLLVASTEETVGFLTSLISPSDLYRSVDNGATFTLLTPTLDKLKIYIRKSNGIQRNPSATNNIFLVCHDAGNRHSVLYVTVDAGQTWKKITLPFLLEEHLVFHPKPARKDWILALDSGKRTLYKSVDGGATWLSIHENVEKFGWSTSPADAESDETIYLSATENSSSWTGISFIDQFFRTSVRKIIRKSANLGKTWAKLMDRVYSYSAKDRYLYVSQALPNDSRRRRLLVSTDGGKQFRHVQLPTITHDRFYSVMDIEDDLVFIHVDDPDDTGHGVLYTSDSSGVVFSESLREHLYPNYNSVTDFYRITSMKGTYLTTRMNPDKSMHTVITYNRGAEWITLPRPDNAVCRDGSQECGLQLANVYSMSMQVNAQSPLTVPTAVGIIVAHGHAATTLKTTPADVFVSSDGGHSWIKALEGPHHYQIADHGGLLVAVPANTTTPNIVKFSTDLGRCWHTYVFTHEQLTFTGLLTEPGNKAMTVAIWGFGGTGAQKRWHVNVVDFTKVIDKQCGPSDYEDWFAHSGLHQDLGETYQGCLLGVKETFRRVKQDSLCKNGYSYEVNKTRVNCLCTMEDFECEYGYYRPMNKMECQRNPQIKELDICTDSGLVELIKTEGYRKIPGDECSGGFNPDKNSQKMLKKNCTDDEDLQVESLAGLAEEDGGHLELHSESGRPNHPLVLPPYAAMLISPRNAILLAVLGASLILIFVVVAVVLVARYMEMRRRLATFKYSLMAAAAAEGGNADSTLGSGAPAPNTVNERDPDRDSQLLFVLADDTLAAVVPSGMRFTVPQPESVEGQVPASAQGTACTVVIKPERKDSDVELIQ